MVKGLGLELPNPNHEAWEPQNPEAQNFKTAGIWVLRGLGFTLTLKNLPF